jgi:hypothetical protein
MKPVLNAPGTLRLRLHCEELLSTFAFKFKLLHYIQGTQQCQPAIRARVLAGGVTPYTLSPKPKP